MATILLTPRQVARELQMSHSWVMKRLADGTLPGIRMGRNWRIPREALQEYIRAKQEREARAGR